MEQAVDKLKDTINLARKHREATEKLVEDFALCLEYLNENTEHLLEQVETTNETLVYEASETLETASRLSKILKKEMLVMAKQQELMANSAQNSQAPLPLTEFGFPSDYEDNSELMTDEIPAEDVNLSELNPNANFQHRNYNRAAGNRHQYFRRFSFSEPNSRYIPFQPIHNPPPLQFSNNLPPQQPFYHHHNGVYVPAGAPLPFPPIPILNNQPAPSGYGLPSPNNPNYGHQQFVHCQINQLGFPNGPAAPYLTTSQPIHGTGSNNKYGQTFHGGVDPINMRLGYGNPFVGTDGYQRPNGFSCMNNNGNQRGQSQAPSLNTSYSGIADVSRVSLPATQPFYWQVNSTGPSSDMPQKDFIMAPPYHHPPMLQLHNRGVQPQQPLPPLLPPPPQPQYIPTSRCMLPHQGAKSGQQQQMPPPPPYPPQPIYRPVPPLQIHFAQTTVHEPPPMAIQGRVPQFYVVQNYLQGFSGHPQMHSPVALSGPPNLYT